MNAKTTDIVRCTEELHGFLAGIAVDYQLEDSEIGQLCNWLETHSNLLHLSPFRELKTILNRILEDGVVDDTEARPSSEVGGSDHRSASGHRSTHIRLHNH